MSEEIINIFKELLHYKILLNETVFKLNAYKRTITYLTHHPDAIRLILNGEKVPSIGKSFRQKIIEIDRTGRLRELQQIKRHKTIKLINRLNSIKGIGIKSAIKFAKRCKTFAEFKKLVRQNKIKLTRLQTFGLNNKINEKIHKSDVKSISKGLMNYLQIDDYTIAGSYRRGNKFSGDIDILIPQKYATPTIMTQVKSVSPEYHSVTKKKFMLFLPSVYTRDFIQVDVRFIEPRYFHFGLLYFTGSATFVREMRADARKQGYKLNEYGLFRKSGARIPKITTEKKLFKKLNITWIPPNKR